MLDFARKLSIPSAVSYLVWRARGSAGPIGLALRSGLKFELRGDGANNDYGVAYEIFVHDYYGNGGRAPSCEMRLIVDLGANVGYSVLYFLHRHTLARVIAFEPHPAHAAQVERNLMLDGSRDRVELYRTAAGARTRTMMLTDAKSSSTLTANPTESSIPVEVIDIFPLLQGKHIDVLKIDIEGGEYEIMADERFARLDVSAVIMEWHSRGGGAEDKLWCENRLRSLGFTIEEIFTRTTYGMFWARR